MYFERKENNLAMKLTYMQLEVSPEKSFSVRQDTLPCIEQDWHFHPELELIFFLKSTGTRYVGNSIGSFAPGELYLIGSNLPHLFCNDRDYYVDKNENEAVDLIVTKFERDFLGKGFLELSESKNIQRLFDRANNGLKFSKSTTYLVHDYIKGLVGSEGLSSVIGLLKILNILAVTDNATALCSDDFSHNYKNEEKERMSEIINFLNSNFDKKIELKEVAAIAHMTPNSFCRFFKKRTQKSFSQYLNEIRVRHACSLLIEGDKQISDVCFQSGYNTFTNFNRHFKNIMHVTPSEFMKKYEVKVNPKNNLEEHLVN